jgi:four helix bundle protein
MSRIIGISPGIDRFDCYDAMACAVLHGVARVETFKDLECWKLADELKQAVYAITARPPLSHDRDFCTDIRRSARSVPANLGEGFGRFDHGEFGRYLSIGLGSLAETENHMHHAHSTGSLSEPEWREVLRLVESTRKATTKLLQYIRRTPTPRFKSQGRS